MADMDQSTADNMFRDMLNIMEEVNSQPLAFNAISVQTIQGALQKILNLVVQQNYPGAYITVHTNWRRESSDIPQFVGLFLYGANRRGAELKTYINELQIQTELMKG